MTEPSPFQSTEHSYLLTNQHLHECRLTNTSYSAIMEQITCHNHHRATAPLLSPVPPTHTIHFRFWSGSKLTNSQSAVCFVQNTAIITQLCAHLPPRICMPTQLSKCGSPSPNFQIPVLTTPVLTRWPTYRSAGQGCLIRHIAADRRSYMDPMIEVWVTVVPTGATISLRRTEFNVASFAPQRPHLMWSIKLIGSHAYEKECIIIW